MMRELIKYFNRSALAIIGVIAFQATSCSTFISGPKVDYEFKPHVVDFGYIIDNSPYQYRVAKASVVLDDLSMDGRSIVGVCLNVGLTSTSIRIDRDFWKTRSFIEQQGLIYHELGHCVCNLKHVVSNGSWIDNILNIFDKQKEDVVFLNDGCPNSLMYPYTLSKRCLDANWYYYLFDLKKKCKAL